MNDDELRKMLQNALAGRRAPTEVRERILGALRPRRRVVWVVAAAAAVILAAAGVLVLRPRPVEPLSPTIARALEQHLQSPVFGHAAASATPREIAQTVSEASGRDIQMPGLRDGGFTQIQAHRCEATGWAHVIYANSWLKVSCFILDSDALDLTGGRPLSVPGIDAHSFGRDQFSVVAVRESGLAKIWVADLRPEHLTSIAVDAEQKRHQLQTTVISVGESGNTKQMGAMLQGTPGVEDFQVEPSNREAVVKYDRRRVTLEQIAALLETNGFSARPREWGVR
jgi:copper chaperone CopZ